ncbi:glutamate receptor ionotropic, kainate 2 isoform X2 [Cephus cinctus]|nr:glutamate receptor ionotropic, kainate 2 isoform X2 [Cephus cinctus]XP_024943090.1 glutamate receptor ionotropic, kainate 2 isoform X2 [Cephus cinctus]
MINEGVVAIFGPTSPHTRGIVSSVAATFDIPHIDFIWIPPEESIYPPTGINVYPNSKDFIQAIADLVKAMKWKRLTAIYETNDALTRIQQVLSLQQPDVMTVNVRELGEPDYRPLLKKVIKSQPYILLSINAENIFTVFSNLKEIRPNLDYLYSIVLDLDMWRLPLHEALKQSRSNITGFEILTENAKDVSESLKFNMQVESALLYDAVFLLNDALTVLNERLQNADKPMVIEPPQLSCNGTGKYSAGPSITNIMREISKEGKLTGYMTFDEEGNREFELPVVEYQAMNFIQTGVWTKDGGLQLTRTESDRKEAIIENIEKKLFRVTTRVGEPYVIAVEEGADRGILIGDKRYEGYCIDLIMEIAKNLKFQYVFELVPDGNYGSLDKKTNEWDGLIKRLLDHAADLAICDLTITYERESVVDFTMPFMHLGISILYSKSDPEEPKLFSFLSPLSRSVWIYMATAYLGVSLMLYIQARISPGEWDNPHPCNPEPEELENNFNLKNSLWLTMGSIMQQGSDILPKAPSIRMVASMWYFFTLIMISSYTANLAAFLTTGKMETQIHSAEDLSKQTKIKYGSVDRGSTKSFFQGSNFSTYQRMWAAMNDARPRVFTSSNDDGVDRVLKSKQKYAFLMESTTILYKIRRNCSLVQIGGTLDTKGYGIAMPRDSPYRTIISGEILRLQENGILTKLQRLWWEEKHGGDTCDGKDTEVDDSSELGLANVGGVFFVLMCGCALSFLVAVLEFLWNVRKVAVQEKITPCEALIAELKFAVNIWAKTKPVKVAKSSSGTSSAAGGLGRAASTARSIVGSFLRLDKLDKFDKDNKTN